MSARFLNTDLVLKARFDLRPSVSALTNSGFHSLQDPRETGGVWSVTLEAGNYPEHPKKSTERLLTAVERLGEAEIALWNRCLKREFESWPVT